jgi:hypothetical protein
MKITISSIWDIFRYGLLFLVCLFIITYSLSAIAVEPSCRNTNKAQKFRKDKGYKGKPGYVVDHICALSCGGLDLPINMQIQSITEAKKKDKWETTKEGCASTCFSFNSLPQRSVFNCKKK